MEQAEPHGQTEGAYGPPAARGVTIRFLSASLPLLALALFIAHVLVPSRPGIVTLVVILLHAIATAIAGIALRASYPHGRLGRANLVTQMRGALTVSLAACIVQPVAPHVGWVLPGVAAACLLLDGVDGWLARRDRLVSEFGARYDMEIDSFLALTLSLVAWRSGEAGAMVLLLGIPRYGFLLAGMRLPWLRAPLPPSFRRKACCVSQIAALILLVSPFAASNVAQWLALAAGVCLYASFAADIAHLRRHRG